MVHFEINGKRLYIDDRIKTQLDSKIIPELKRKDMDAVFIVDGKERIGKSVFAMSIGSYVASCFKSKFDLSNICLNPLEFRDKIQKASKNETVIYDEAHRGMGSAGALTEINKILKDLMMEMGQKNLFVVVVLPTFFLLDRYIVLFRARGLFHIYTNKRQRGYWVFYNERNKKRLFLKGKKEFNYNCITFPSLRGRFMNGYPVSEEEYRKKKSKSFKEGFRQTRNETAEQNTSRLAPLLKKEYGLTIDSINNLYKHYKIVRSRASIALDLRKYTEKTE